MTNNQPESKRRETWAALLAVSLMVPCGASQLLRNQDLRVLSPASVPANDGGLSLGQAVIASALSD